MPEPLTATTEVKMPKLGMEMEMGTITRWLKAEGDSVAEEEEIVEFSTDKVDATIPAPASGVLARIVATEGAEVPIGGVVALIEN